MSVRRPLASLPQLAVELNDARYCAAELGVASSALVWWRCGRDARHRWMADVTARSAGVQRDLCRSWVMFHAVRVWMPRYRLGARCYDLLSMERLLYRRGRLAAVDLVAPRCGDRVLDVGCGTGLSFGPVVRAVGGAGRVVGVDASPAMLRRAKRRVDRQGWHQVRLVQTDARQLASVSRDPFDVILFCYSLSIVPHWPAVWEQALRCVAPGGRIAVVDTAYLTGWRRVLNPLVWVLLTAGGVCPGRRVWDAVAWDTDGSVQRRLLAGHVRVAVGTARGEREGTSGER